MLYTGDSVDCSLPRVLRDILGHRKHSSRINSIVTHQPVNQSFTIRQKPARTKCNSVVNIIGFGVLPINFVLDVRKLCFLSKQRCHSISVHNVFYDIFGFSEFYRLCSVYSVRGQSRGYFIASVMGRFS